MPNGGTISGVIGTVENQQLVYFSVTQAIGITTSKIEDAILQQKHESLGDFPSLTVQFRNGSTAIMPSEVYLNKDGEVYERAGSAKSMRAWIEANCPEELKGKRLSVAIYAHYSAIWKNENTP